MRDFLIAPYRADGELGGAVGNVFCSIGGGGGGQPASEKTAQYMAKQIERRLEKTHAVPSPMRSRAVSVIVLAELKADAKALYEEFGKTPPKWMQ